MSCWYRSNREVCWTASFGVMCVCVCVSLCVCAARILPPRNTIHVLWRCTQQKIDSSIGHADVGNKNWCAYSTVRTVRSLSLTHTHTHTHTCSSKEPAAPGPAVCILVVPICVPAGPNNGETVNLSLEKQHKDSLLLWRRGETRQDCTPEQEQQDGKTVWYGSCVCFIEKPIGDWLETGERYCRGSNVV